MTAETRVPAGPTPADDDEGDEGGGRTPRTAPRTGGPGPRGPVYVVRRQTSIVWGALGLVVAGAAASLAWNGRQVSLFSDDYIFLTEGREMSWSLDYLRLALFEHFSPVSRVVHKLVTGEVADHPQVVTLVLLAFAVGLVVSVAVLMAAVCGPRWSAVVGTALVAPGLSVLPLMNWWTAGVNIMPAMAGAALCLGGMILLVRGVGGPRWSMTWGVVALVAYLVGVLSWELATTAPGFALLWVLLFHRRVTPEPLLSILRRTAWAWAGLVVIGALTVVNYLRFYYRKAPSASVSDDLHALYTSLVETQLPMVLGIHQPAAPLVHALGVVAGLVVLALLVAVTCRRSPTAWRGWVFAAVGWLVPAVALVVSRVGFWGVVVAEQPTYYFLPTVLVMVGVLEAWLAPRRARTMSAGGPAVGQGWTPPPWRTPSRGRIVGVVAAAVAVVVAYTSSVPATVRSIFEFGAVAQTGAPMRDYVPNLIASADRLRAAGTAFSVVSGEAPAGLVPPGFSPFNRLSRIMMVNDPSLPFDRGDGPWYAPGGDGTLLPATPVWQKQLVLTAPDTVASLGIAGMSVVSQDARTGLCLRVTDASGHLVVPLGGTVAGDRTVIRTEATVSRTTPGRTIVGVPDGGFLPANVDVKRWEAGATGRLDTAFEPSISSVGFDELEVGTDFCVRTISVGQLTLG